MSCKTALGKEKLVCSGKILKDTLHLIILKMLQKRKWQEIRKGEIGDGIEKLSGLSVGLFVGSIELSFWLFVGDIFAYLSETSLLICRGHWQRTSALLSLQQRWLIPGRQIEKQDTKCVSDFTQKNWDSEERKRHVSWERREIWDVTGPEFDHAWLINSVKLFKSCWYCCWRWSWMFRKVLVIVLLQIGAWRQV